MPRTGTVKSATLWLVTDLAPRATNNYTVRYGADASSPGGVKADLQLRATDDQVEMTTSGFGARLRLGEQTFDPARAPADVPGPLVALRLADGTWFGDSRLFGKAKLTSWSGRLTAEGPVFGQVDYVYRYANGNIVKLTARLSAGAAGLSWESQVTRDRPDEGVDILLSRPRPPGDLALHQSDNLGHEPRHLDGVLSTTGRSLPSPLGYVDGSWKTRVIWGEA